MSQKIYFDYGSGWEDVTDDILDTLSITHRFSTDDYRHAQNVANFTMKMNDQPEIPDGSTAYYYMDDWLTDDGWTLTLGETALPTTRGGIYKTDFVTISGNTDYVIKLKCTATAPSQIILVGERSDDTFEELAVSFMPGGESVLTFVVNHPDAHTGLGFVWDARVNVEWQWLYVGDGLWVSNLDKLRDATEVKVKILEDTTQIYQGIIASKPSYIYNGIFANLTIDLEATDRLLKLDVETEDFVMRNAKIMDYADADNSIVHQLAYEAGLTVDDIAEIQILTTLSGFSPSSEKSSILTEMSSLLYEHGYVLHMDEYDRIHPLPWIMVSGIAAYTFNEDNILKEIEVSENERIYEGIKVKYNELGEKHNVLLYKDDLPMNNDGTFTGYIIPSGLYYPLEANTIDETTGTNQVVYQEYEDTGIQALTNKGIVDKLDFDPRTAMKVFKSDFSSIVATSGHYLEKRIDGDITPDIAVYGNKKAQIRFQNTAASGINIYYLNIRGSCLYKTADRFSEVITISGSKKIDEYDSSYIYDQTTADRLAQFIALEQDVGRFSYVFESEDSVAEGSLVQITNDARTDQLCIVIEKVYNVKDDIYRYTCKGYDINTGTITGRNIIKTSSKNNFDVISVGLSSYNINILSDINGENLQLADAYVTCKVLQNGMDVTDQWTFAEVSTSGVLGSIADNIYTISGMTSDSGYVDIGFSRTNYTSQTLRCNVNRNRQVTPEIIYEIVPEYTPVYLGIHLDSEPAYAKNGDSYLRYSTTSGLTNRGVFVYDGTDWNRTLDPDYIYNALNDIVYICQILSPDGLTAIYGVESDHGINSSIDISHIKAAIIDLLRAGDVHITGTLTSPVLDTVPRTDGSEINSPLPSYWSGSELYTICSGFSDGWTSVSGTLDSKNITHVIKGGSDNSISYQSDDAEVTGHGATLKTITSAVNGRIRIYYDYYGTGRISIQVNFRSIFSTLATGTSYSTYYLDTNVQIGDLIEFVVSGAGSGSITIRNFRICPAIDTIGLWNNSDDTAISIQNSGYYNETGTVYLGIQTLVTENIDDYWAGSELINSLYDKLSPYVEINVASGIFDSKTCSSIYLSSINFARITFTDTSTLTIQAPEFYTYSGSIILNDVEGKILLGDENNEGQYELWSHDIPGTTDNILTVRNTKADKVFSIWETRAPDTTSSGFSEATFSLHNVVGVNDYVHDHSMHNYSNEMHFIDGFYNYGGDYVGDWKKVAKRVVSEWQASTPYGYGDLVHNDGGKVYVCTYYGTSGSSGGPTGEAARIDEGGCIWRYVGLSTDGIWEFSVATIYSQSGAIKTSGGRIPTGFLAGSATTDDEIFQTIASTCRSGYLSGYVTQLIVHGAIGNLIVSHCNIEQTRIIFSGISSGSFSTLTINEGGTTTRQISISW